MKPFVGGALTWQALRPMAPDLAGQPAGALGATLLADHDRSCHFPSALFVRARIGLTASDVSRPGTPESASVSPRPGCPHVDKLYTHWH
jgi:hypothetical protein